MTMMTKDHILPTSRTIYSYSGTNEQKAGHLMIGTKRDDPDRDMLCEVEALRAGEIPDLELLIKLLEYGMKYGDIDDEFLDRPRNGWGYGEYIYGIYMVAASWVMPYLEELRRLRNERVSV